MNQPKREERTQAPSIMQIIAAVSRATNMSIDAIMGSRRAELLIMARAAICKISASHGYDMPEIMDYINLNRTVGYNYKAKIEGHLKNDLEFMELCKHAEIELAKVPARANKTIKALSSKSTAKSEQAKQPMFRKYKSPFGWEFTANEMKRMYELEKEAEEFMANYDKQDQTKPSKHGNI